MAIHGTILALELSARGGANDACTGTNAVCTGTRCNSSSRFSTNSTRVIRAARTQPAPITVLLVSSP
jgi:hypothetical protein